MRNDHVTVEALQRDAVQDNLKSLIRHMEKGSITPNDLWIGVRDLVDRVSMAAGYIDQEAYKQDGVFAWKTGRNYSQNGQRIAALVLPDNRVAFYDIDREIAGITIPHLPVGAEIRKFVMNCYDAPKYTEDFTPTLSWVEARSLSIRLATAAGKL